MFAFGFSTTSRVYISILSRKRSFIWSKVKMKKLYFHISSQIEIMHEYVSDCLHWNSILYLHVHTKTSTIDQHGTRSLKYWK